MTERKQASVQYVHHIVPIDGADRIECVQVPGWNVVAKKGDFKVVFWKGVCYSTSMGTCNPMTINKRLFIG